MKFERLSIRSRLNVLLAAVAVMFGVMIALFVNAATNSKEVATRALAENLLAQQKEKLRVATHSVAVTLSKGVARFDSAEDKAEALRLAIDDIRFEEDESGYFFIYRETVNVALPTNKSIVGKDLGDAVDANGVFFVREMRDQAKSGGGFVFYHFEKPGMGITPKLSYSEMIEGTDLWIGAGVYIDNIAAQTELLNETLGDELRGDQIALLTISGGFFLLVILPFSYLIVRSVAKPLENAVGGLRSRSAGILNASKEIANASDALASGAAEQAASIEETGASICEMANLSDRNAERADQALVIMSATNRSVAEVSGYMQKLHGSMDRISKSSRQMQAIIKTIDEIAFQTNILALNAAVEAARAGSAGSGFSVVADEVRSLASRSAIAAKDTAGLIESSVSIIDEGAGVMRSASESFAGMQAKANEVGEILQQIEGFSKEQSAGVRQVNVASEQMNHVVQVNAAHAQECAAASIQLEQSFRDFGGIITLIEKTVRGSQSGGETGNGLPIATAGRVRLAPKDRSRSFAGGAPSYGSISSSSLSSRT